MANYGEETLNFKDYAVGDIVEYQGDKAVVTDVKTNVGDSTGFIGTAMISKLNDDGTYDARGETYIDSPAQATRIGNVYDNQKPIEYIVSHQSFSGNYATEGPRPINVPNENIPGGNDTPDEIEGELRGGKIYDTSVESDDYGESISVETKPTRPDSLNETDPSNGIFGELKDGKIYDTSVESDDYGESISEEPEPTRPDSLNETAPSYGPRPIGVPRDPTSIDSIDMYSEFSDIHSALKETDNEYTAENFRVAVDDLKAKFDADIAKIIDFKGEALYALKEAMEGVIEKYNIAIDNIGYALEPACVAADRLCVVLDILEDLQKKFDIKRESYNTLVKNAPSKTLEDSRTIKHKDMVTGDIRWSTESYTVPNPGYGEWLLDVENLKTELDNLKTELSTFASKAREYKTTIIDFNTSIKEFSFGN